MNTLRVELKNHIDNSYDILFTKDVELTLVNNLKKYAKKRIFVITDNNVGDIYLQKFNDRIGAIITNSYIIQAGEKSKNIDTVIKIVEEMLKLGYNRDDYVVALGGGVVGDLAGFAASIYKRGIDYIQIPTTLLAMYDSSVGGKTGVNLSSVKNIVGAFKQPKLVIVNKLYLKTLDVDGIISGYFEGLKHSILDGKDHYEYYKMHAEYLFKALDNICIDELLVKNIAVKANIVMKDEKEKGIRKYLNYGHTLGHAIEAVLDGQIPHGLGVAIGIVYVNILAAMIGKLDPLIANQINEFVKSKINIKSDLVIGLNFNDLYNKMLKDKKNKKNAINLVLLKDLGQMTSYETQDYDLLAQVYEQLIEFLDK